MDLARLQIAIEHGDIKAAEQELSRLAGTSSKVEKQLDDLQQSSRAVADAVAANAKQTQLFNQQSAALNASLGTLNKTLAGLGKTTQKTENTQKQAAAGVKTLQNAMTRANPTALAFSQIISDSPYGLIGMANNIDPLITSFVRLKQSIDPVTGKMLGAKGAFAEVLKAIRGPMGLIVGFSIFSAAMAAAGPYVDKFMRQLLKSKEETEEFKKALAGISEYSELTFTVTVNGLKEANEELMQMINNFARLGRFNAYEETIKKGTSSLWSRELQPNQKARQQASAQDVAYFDAQLKRMNEANDMLVQYRQGLAHMSIENAQGLEQLRRQSAEALREQLDAQETNVSQYGKILRLSKENLSLVQTYGRKSGITQRFDSSFGKMSQMEHEQAQLANKIYTKQVANQRQVLKQNAQHSNKEIESLTSRYEKLKLATAGEFEQATKEFISGYEVIQKAVAKKVTGQGDADKTLGIIGAKLTSKVKDQFTEFNEQLIPSSIKSYIQEQRKLQSAYEDTTDVVSILNEAAKQNEGLKVFANEIANIASADYDKAKKTLAITGKDILDELTRPLQEIKEARVPNIFNTYVQEHRKLTDAYNTSARAIEALRAAGIDQSNEELLTFAETLKQLTLINYNDANKQLASDGGNIIRSAAGVRIRDDAISDYQKELVRYQELLDNKLILDTDYAQLRKDALDRANAEILSMDKSLFGQMNQQIRGWEDTLSSSLTTLVYEGDLSFISLADSFARMISEMVIKLAVVQPLMNSIFGSAGSLSLNSSIDSAISANPSIFALGGIPGRRVEPFAKGYVNSIPTIFPMANGGVGMMSEFGQDEAVMPLQRTADGRLGVAANLNNGVQSAAQNITIEVINKSGTEVEATQTATTQNGTNQIVTIVLEAVKSNTLGSRKILKALLTK